MDTNELKYGYLFNRLFEAKEEKQMSDMSEGGKMSLRKVGHIILRPGEYVELSLLHKDHMQTIKIRAYEDRFGLQKRLSDFLLTLRYHIASPGTEVVVWLTEVEGEESE